MDETVKKNDETHEPAREEYEAPRVIEEQTFATTVLACSSADLNCIVPQS